MEQPIRFSQPNQPFGFLSPSSHHSIFIDGRTWPTVEHYVQAQRFAETAHNQETGQTSFPQESTAIGYDPERPQRPDWDEIKDAIMRKALKEKFTFHTDLKTKLLLTGSREIIAYMPYDRYWGKGDDDTGQNKLGILLMEVREAIRAVVSKAHAMPPTSQWCLVGNAVTERPYGPGGQETKRGTKHFPPGTKLYCLPPQWDSNDGEIIVIGRHRGSKKFRTMVIRSMWVTNWRAQVVYNPEILRRIHVVLVPYGRNWNSKEDVEKFVKVLKKREAEDGLRLL